MATTFDLNPWRALMASMPDNQGRWTVFENAAYEFARLVPEGLDRTHAIDTLQGLANAYALNTDDVQTILADNFADARPDVVPPLEDIAQVEYILEAPQPKKQNGKATPPKLQSTAEFIRAFVPPDFLVNGILQRRFIYSLTGQTGHAKTAVALLLASLVGSTWPNARLANHKVEHGRVIYFVGENPDDVRMRVIGATDWPKEQEDRISWIVGIFDLAEMFSVLDADCKSNGDAALIIVDTSAAYFLGNEELNNVQMGAYARTLRRLTTLPGKPTALILCHPIKHVIEPSQLLPRGGGAYLNEMDGNLTLWRTGEDMVELSHAGKFRGPDFAPVTFKLETIGNCPRLVDAKGNQIKTIQAVAISQREEDSKLNQETADEDELLAVMLQNPKQTHAEFAIACQWTIGDGVPNKKKVERVLKRMEVGKPKLCTRNRHGWVLTDKGKEQAREVALRQERDRVAADQRRLDLSF